MDLAAGRAPQETHSHALAPHFKSKFRGTERSVPNLLLGDVGVWPGGHVRTSTAHIRARNSRKRKQRRRQHAHHGLSAQAAGALVCLRCLLTTFKLFWVGFFQLTIKKMKKDYS